MNILILASDLEMNICYHSDKHIISNILGTLRVISDSIHILDGDEKELKWFESWKEFSIEDRYLLGNIYNSTEALVGWIVNEDDESRQMCKLIIACCYYLALVDEYVYRFEKDPEFGIFYYKIELLLSVLKEQNEVTNLCYDRDEIYTAAFYSMQHKLCKLTQGFESGNIIRDYQALLRRHKNEFSQFTKRPVPNFYQKDMYDTFQ